jgi:hypothetical protein
MRGVALLSWQKECCPNPRFGKQAVQKADRFVSQAQP